MFARKIVPILLVAGAVHLAMRHSWGGCEEQSAAQPGDGPARSPQFRHGPFARRGAQSAWANRVPPLFEMWHNRAHEQAAQPPSASTPLM
jgi:hypothetical protein